MPEVDAEAPPDLFEKPGCSAAGRPAVCLLVLAEVPIFRSDSSPGTAGVRSVLARPIQPINPIFCIGWMSATSKVASGF